MTTETFFVYRVDIQNGVNRRLNEACVIDHETLEDAIHEAEDLIREHEREAAYCTIERVPCTIKDDGRREYHFDGEEETVWEWTAPLD